MQAPISHKINDQTFWLSGQRMIFWEEEKALILSDLHLGKTGHFRKAGIAIPQNILQEDLQRLLDALSYFKAEQLIVVGDFFHSTANRELELFQRWRNDFSHVRIRLVKGNHDILKKDWYAEAEIELIDDTLFLGSFCFTHDHCREQENKYTFCGHVHPGIMINGLGRQSLRFPCFYFTPSHCILPAFGKFTGLYNIQPRAHDIVFAVVDKSLIRIK